MKTDTNCKRKRGSPGVRGVLPEVTATLLKQHHQSSISCHSPKLRSEQIHVSGKGQILACALTQLDSLPLTQCQERPVLLCTRSMLSRSSLMTSSAPQCPLLTRVGPPPSITHFERLRYETDLSRKLSGELTRRASARQLDVAQCHNWHRFPSFAALEMTLVSVQSETLTQRHRGSPSREPFPIFSLPKSSSRAGFSMRCGRNNMMACFS